MDRIAKQVLFPRRVSWALRNMAAMGYPWHLLEATWMVNWCRFPWYAN